VRRRAPLRRALVALCALGVLAAPAAAWAYVGPGAGIAFLGTAVALFVAVLLALAGVLTWPFRHVYLLLTRPRPARPARARRVIVVGLDGLDPELCRRFMAEGKLPALSRLAAQGTFRELRTTCPAISPVAWSSFATGVDPSKHGIFDFFTRDPRTYQPVLSSVVIRPPARELRLGPYRLPLGKPRLKGLRKSVSFWKILGQHRVPCSILRVPLTFPAERFDGRLLAGMCVPDLLGTQGSFTAYGTAAAARPDAGGAQVRVTVAGGRVATALAGPPNPLRADGAPLSLPLTVQLQPDGGAELRLGPERVVLTPGRLSDWVPVAFPLGLGLKLRGMCRFRLGAADPFQLYASAIHLDPGQPALPLSHPFIFSVFLAKLCGRYATLGLAEDTWALSEGALDEAGFLEQLRAYEAEREALFFEVLKRTRRGVLTFVFDGTDRVQHMFMRRLPAPGTAPVDAAAGAIEATYRRMDALLGRVMDEVDVADPRNVLVVVSDHGFKPFTRQVNLNAWLRAAGYLTLADGAAGGEWLAGVDWARTRAFSLGLAGIYLNVRGREAKGIVEPGAAARDLADEIAGKLRGLVDAEEGGVAIRDAYPTHRRYHGPYAEDGPDVLVGYAAGWRASWQGARGIVAGPVCAPNDKAWSGDHCIDPDLVPGVLFASQPLGDDGADPSITDLAPTLLDYFGVAAPAHMDGRSLLR
jgi:predicted AlkP superfamily phosphohydrolase/phosphomutase